MQPPFAPRRPHRLEHHGVVREDDWFWLNRRDDPDVVRYLEAENAYTDSVLASGAELRETLFHELRERIPQNDTTVPVKIRDHWYLSRTEDGKDYPIHFRRPAVDGPDSMVLDENAVAAGLDYCDVGARAIGADQDLLAYAVDTVGRRLYEIRFRRLDTGEDLPDRIEGTSGDIAWAEDGRTIFYTRKDPQTLRPDRVFRHVLGTDPADDVCVFHDTDETYYVSLGKTTSRRFVLIVCDTTLRTRGPVPARRPSARRLERVPAREGEHEYDVDHYGDWWWITSNENARNFRLFAGAGRRSRQARVGRRSSGTATTCSSAAWCCSATTWWPSSAATPCAACECSTTTARNSARSSSRTPSTTPAWGSTWNPTCRVFACSTARWARRPRPSSSTWPPVSGGS